AASVAAPDPPAPQWQAPQVRGARCPAGLPWWPPAAHTGQTAAAARGHTMSSSSSSPSHDPRDTAPADPPPGYPDLGPQPVDGVRLLRAPAVPTAVVRATGVPMATIAGFFDSAFGTAFPALFAAGVTPAGPAFALYTRTTEEPEPAADLE